MIISKKNLKLMIESYLSEKDSNDSNEESGQDDDSKLSSTEQSYNVGDHTFKISINNKTGVAVDIQIEGRESKKIVIKKDDNEDIKDKLRNILSGIGRTTKNKESYQNLIKSVNTYFEYQLLKDDQLAKHKARFAAEFGFD